MSADHPLADAPPDQPEQIERSAQSRLAVQMTSVVAPLLERQRRAALARVFDVLDKGGMPSAPEALAAVLELYAVQRLESALLRAARRGNLDGGAQV